MSTTLRFRGCCHFRQRIVCSILSKKPVLISGIREKAEQPGLQGFEANFLRLIEQLTNGSRIEINETGTTLRFIPGFISGGKLQHDCGVERSIGYFLEGILPLAPFSKKPFALELQGVTNDDRDLSIDTIRDVTLPIFEKFGAPGATLKVKRRGAPPGGGGLVLLRCPIVRQLCATQMVDAGYVKRIRGVAYCTKVSPHTSNRMIDSTRALLNKFIPDVYVYSDHNKGKEGGNSPGFGLTLVAESTEGCLVSAESTAVKGTLPEDLGVLVSELLCAEIGHGGVVDASHQWLPLLLMLLCPEDVSKIRLGKLTKYTIKYLRHLHAFFGVTFQIETDRTTSPEPTVLLTCMGIGFKNVSKKVT